MLVSFLVWRVPGAQEGGFSGGSGGAGGVDGSLLKLCFLMNCGVWAAYLHGGICGVATSCLLAVHCFLCGGWGESLGCVWQWVCCVLLDFDAMRA